ncbi:MAG: hypothetical protein AAGD38_08880 [Acidobacteriota bacterium]
MTASMLLYCLLAVSSPPTGLGAPPSPELAVAPGAVIQLPDDQRYEAAWGGGVLRALEGDLTAPTTSGVHWLTVVARDVGCTPSDPLWVRVQVAAGNANRIALDDAPITGDIVWVKQGQALEGYGTVCVDGSAPEIDLRFGDQRGTAPDGAPVLGPGATIEANVRDVDSGVASWRPMLNGEVVAGSAWQSPPTGRHTVSAVARDHAGNEHTSPAQTVIVDRAGPEVELMVHFAGVEGDNGELWYRPPVQASLAVDEPYAEVVSSSISVGGTPLEPGRNGTFLLDVPRVDLAATDSFGNRTEKTVNLYFDRVQPWLVVFVGDRVVNPGTTFSVSPGETIVVRAWDEDSGVVSVRTSIDSGPWKDQRELVFDTAGRHRIEAEAIDYVGRRRNVGWRVTIGDSAPTTAGESLSAGESK